MDPAATHQGWAAIRKDGPEKSPGSPNAGGTGQMPGGHGMTVGVAGQQAAVPAYQAS